LEAKAANEILSEIRRRLDYFYLKVQLDAETRGSKPRALPPLASVAEKLGQASFRVFSDPGQYVASDRAARARETLPDALSSLGRDVFRVFFNDHSKKVYIDLNHPRWEETGDRLGLERLYCELLKAFLLLSAVNDPSENPEAPPLDRTYVNRGREEAEEVPLVDVSRLDLSARKAEEDATEDEAADCPVIDTEVP
jgi:hypothetical protein